MKNERLKLEAIVNMKAFKQISCIVLALMLSQSVFAQTNQYPFWNSNLPVEERIINAISLTTLDEKTGFMHFMDRHAFEIDLDKIQTQVGDSSADIRASKTIGVD